MEVFVLPGGLLPGSGLIAELADVAGRLLQTPMTFFKRWPPRLTQVFSFREVLDAGVAPECSSGRGGSGGGMLSPSSAIACHSGDETDT